MLCRGLFAFFLLVCLFPVARVNSSAVDVLPQPKVVQATVDCKSWAQVSSSTFSFQLATPLTNARAKLIVNEAFNRTLVRMFQDEKNGLHPYRNNIHEKYGEVWPTVPCVATPLFKLNQLKADIQLDNVDLEIGVDESYTLDIAASVATLSASTVWGFLHGLETFTQLVVWSTVNDANGNRLNNTNVIPNVPIVISDEPRYKWRGLLLDSSRHFLPLHVVEKTIDGLAMTKMNVLHWHLIDAESFPFVSNTFPELSAKGAYGPRAIYAPQNISHIVDYANKRGVLVVPEFDMPGHSGAIVNGRPDVCALCWPYLQGRSSTARLRWPAWDNIALDVTKASTWQFVQALWRDVLAAFPSRHLHLGGDEVNGNCWSSLPAIRSYMQTHNLTKNDTNPSAPPPEGYVRAWPSSDGRLYDTGALQLEFELKLDGFIHGQNRISVLWEEAFYDSFSTHGASYPPLDKDAIVHVWKDAATFAKAVKHNRTMLSSFDWYLDRTDPTCQGTCDNVGYAWVMTWTKMYAQDPIELAVTAGADRAAAEKLMLGGEIASWGESVDSANNAVRVWTRGCAVAERLWSPVTVNSTSEVWPRMTSWRCKARRNGVNAGATQPGYCDVPSDYTPTADLQQCGGTALTGAREITIAIYALAGTGALMVLCMLILLVVACRRRQQQAFVRLNEEH